jgi:hypothetical protein
MKKIIVLLTVSFLAVTVNAQLRNTKWNGQLNIQNGMNTLFNFSNDTLEVVNNDNNESLETMKYTIKDSLLTLQKLYGSSQCDTSTSGVYKFQIAENELTLTLVSDECPDRAEAIGTMKLQKQE